jgi:hypothetical protein
MTDRASAAPRPAGLQDSQGEELAGLLPSHSDWLLAALTTAEGPLVVWWSLARGRWWSGGAWREAAGGLVEPGARPLVGSPVRCGQACWLAASEVLLLRARAVALLVAQLLSEVHVGLGDGRCECGQPRQRCLPAPATKPCMAVAACR